MLTALHQVSVRLLYPFAAALRDEGVDLDPLLTAAAIPRSTYDNQDSRVPYTAARHFYGAAAATSRHSALGLAAARHYALTRFQLLEYFVASSTHVGGALQDLVHREAVFADDRALSLESRTEGLLLRVEPVTAGAHRCWFEFVIGALYLAGRRIVGASPTKARGSSAWFAYARPDCATDYNAFFNGLVKFDAPAHGLLVPPPVLQASLEGANTRLRELLEPHLNGSVAQVLQGSSLLDRIRALLTEALPYGDPGMDAIAAKVHMSRSTLRRRLALEGTTHRALLRHMRKAAALQYLRRADLSLSEVAYLVGYDDSTSFHKAFKQWTGCTPAEYRVQNSPDGPKQVVARSSNGQ
jgi:AraC-like DNA-binding protein